MLNAECFGLNANFFRNRVCAGNWYFIQEFNLVHSYQKVKTFLKNMQILILWSFIDLFLKTEEAVAFPQKNPLLFGDYDPLSTFEKPEKKVWP